MFNNLKKLTVAAALVTSSALVSANTITIDNSAGVAPGTGTTFNASALVGAYNEVVLSDGAGNFQATIVLKYGSFVPAPNQSLNAGITRLDVDYSLYSIINITGSVTTVNAPGVITTGNWSGDYNIVLDNNLDSPSDLASSITGIGSTTLTPDVGDDVTLVSGTISSGGSSGNATFPGNPASGGFTLLSNTVSLTTAGESFFVAPNPFFTNLISFGSLENFFDEVNFGLTTLQTFNGAATVEFVPEPSGIVLLGLGLFGVAYAARRKSA